MLLITGLFCKKYGVLTDAAINALNKFIIIIGYPCLILARTTTLDMGHTIFINFLLSLSITLGIFILLAAYSHLYCRSDRFPAEDKAVYEFAIIAPNNGFMGFPVALTFFGDLGLLYMIGTNIALNIIFFTFGITIFKRGRETAKETVSEKLLRFVKMIAHPGIVAAIVGIVICYNNIELPGILSGYLNLVGAVATPMAMISIGTMLAGGFGINSFKKRQVMEPVLNKLIIMPVITALIVWFLPIDPLVKTLLVISNTMPVATMVPIFSEQYGRNKNAAVEILVVSTLFSMATIPAAVWILPHLGI